MARKINCRERMDSDSERLMQKHALLIEKHVEAMDITGHLYSKFVLNFDDKNEIENEKKRLTRIRLLTSRLIAHGGIHAFSAFLEALKDAGYHDIRKTLMTSEQALENPPNIVRPKAPVRDKFNNELARRKTTESKLSFLCAKVKGMEETIKSKPKQDPVLMKAILDIKGLLEESRETTKTMEGLARQLEEKEKKLKEAEEKIKELEEKIQVLKKEKELDRQTITHLKSKVDMLEVNDRLKDEELQKKGEEIAELQSKQTRNEERLEEIENLLKRQKTEEYSRPSKNLKPTPITPRNRFQKK